MVTAGVRPLGPVGSYTVAYRIVSDDGHPVSGTVTFRLTAAATGTPNPPPAGAAPGAPGAPGAGGGSGGVPVWPFVVGGLVLLAGGVVAVLRLGRAG